MNILTSRLSPGGFTATLEKHRVDLRAHVSNFKRSQRTLWNDEVEAATFWLRNPFRTGVGSGFDSNRSRAPET
jgi:hypothetical protein